MRPNSTTRGARTLACRVGTLADAWGPGIDTSVDAARKSACATKRAGRRPTLPAAVVWALTGTLLAQQAAPPPPPVRIFQPPPPPEQAKPQPQQQQPAQQQPAQPQPGQPQPAQPAAPAPAQPPRLAAGQGFMLDGVSLTQMISILAERLKINYILDPRVKGTVMVYTYGEVREPVDLMPLLQTVLRVNGAAMVKVGEFYRIVPINSISNLPIDVQVNVDQKTLPDDERMILNLVFLKYATAAEIDKLLTPFYGEGAGHSVYEPANLLILQDNSRNMKRTLDLISMFDSDTFAGQRVRLFDIDNSLPSDLVKELESVFKAYALSDKTAVKFIPVDRINTLIAVAPNPGVFQQVAEWIKKLDIPVKLTAGGINNYVYRLKYGRAETLAMAIMALYSGDPFALASLGSMMGGMGYGGGMGFGGGMGYPGMGFGGGMGYPGYPGGGFGGGYGRPGFGGGYGGMGYQQFYPPPMNTSPFANPALQGQVAQGQVATPGATVGQTGTYLGAPSMQAQPAQRLPHIIPNPFDNTLLIQATPQEYEQISNLIRQLDIAPRQVLIDAKIYEVDLSGAFASGVQAFLQKRDRDAQGNGKRSLTADLQQGVLTLSTGALVLRSHELLLAVAVAESRNQTRVVASPSIIATDSVPATMIVGQEVPVLTASVATGVQQDGNTAFANTIANRSAGTSLNILARVNSSGIITMIIDQEVSQPQANTVSNISSPAFQKRSFSTQVTVQDGDTIALGGFIQETLTDEVIGIPFLNRIPILGNAFGSRAYSKARTELVVFLTPRVIYDTTQISDASDEIKGRLKRLQKIMKDEQ